MGTRMPSIICKYIKWQGREESSEEQIVGSISVYLAFSIAPLNPETVDCPGRSQPNSLPCQPHNSKDNKRWGVKNFLTRLTTSRNGPVISTETRQGWKHRKTTLLQKNGGRKTPEDYILYICCIVRQMGNSPLVFLYQRSSCVFLPGLVSLLFTGPLLLVVTVLQKNFYP